MKSWVCLLLLLVLSISAIAQKTLLVEKIGRSAKYYYHIGDNIKIRTDINKTIIKGKITEIRDSSISISFIKSVDVNLNEIRCVYEQFAFSRYLGIKLGQFGFVIFVIMAGNNLINNSQLFTPYVFIVSGSFLGASLISLVFSERPCKIGDRWKLKILDGFLK